MIEQTKQSIKYIDATPDENYPIRILEAYLDENKWSSTSIELDETNPLIKSLNDLQEQRNKLIRGAISILKGN